ncbi:vWA domain-containing protein [Sutcliffiella rhizosphaerae]|uniref:VWFA domain-containing protein n=1 Tax=Sutcliffiella rhizosphaerae TaxID=2880967 RepID=A0ABM8YK32_9BACI|nr:VWA domain-containing protein [Sutcliffiella rhizosphaerae]CAG9620272.1 hypothetical protein BACCIP111883_01040 [Sutcliffiella rhizosphaerae]
MRGTLAKNIFLLVLLSILLILGGCQNNSTGNTDAETNNPEDTASEEPKDNEVEEDTTQEVADNNVENEELLETIRNADTIPETIEGVVNYPVGEFAHIKSTTDEVKDYLKTLPALAEDASEEEVAQYLNYIYSLFKVDYESPDSLIESMEILNSDNPDEVIDQNLQKEQYNVVIALDASGSMGNYIGDKTMMEIAKEAISKYVASLPEDANVGLRVYGHEGSGSDTDKQLSCKANDLIYEIGQYNESNFNNALNPIQPAGWTPLADALLQSAEDLKKFSAENSRNIIYFVSDGIETCDGNPVEAAKTIKASGIDPVVNIIGFGVSSEEGEQLKKIAEAADGNYADAQNQSQLNEQFTKSIEEVRKWQAWHLKSRDEIMGNYSDNFWSVAHWQQNWMSNNIEFFLSASTAITNLSIENKISYEQRDWMQEELREKRKIQENEVGDLYSKLFELNKDNYNSMMKEVNEIYKQNRQ